MIYAKENINGEKCPSFFLHLFPIPFLTIRSPNIFTILPCFYMIHIFKKWTRKRSSATFFLSKTFRTFFNLNFFLTLDIKLLCNIKTVLLHICCKFYLNKNFEAISKNMFYTCTISQLSGAGRGTIVVLPAIVCV